TYDAFISYSHESDAAVAPILRDALARFASSWRQRRALRVYVDELNLVANPDLWPRTAAALDDADWLIVLASPEAAASETVTREIEHWLAHRPHDRILPVLTGGEWATAVPPALRDVFSDEADHVDLRWARDNPSPTTSPQWQPALIEMAAAIHGTTADDIESRDLEARDRTRRVARRGAIALAIVAVLAIAATVFTSIKARDATNARGDADFHRAVEHSHDLRNSNRQLAALLAVEAYHE